MNINLDKHIVKDIPGLMFKNLETYEMREYEGLQLDWNALNKEDRRYIVYLVYTAYLEGAERVVEQINKGEERERRQAQDRAIRKIMKGEY